MKSFKIALAMLALAATAASAQDKAALVREFVELQKPGIEALARGMVESSSAPIAQAGSQYLQTQVPAEKRESAAKAADAELKKYFDDAYPVVRSKALEVAPGAIGPVLEQSFSEDELRQIVTWIKNPVSQKYQQANRQMQDALTERIVADTRGAIEPKMRELDTAVANALGAPTGGAAGAPAKKPAAAPAKAPAKKQPAQ